MSLDKTPKIVSIFDGKAHDESAVFISENNERAGLGQRQRFVRSYSEEPDDEVYYDDDIWDDDLDDGVDGIEYVV